MNPKWQKLASLAQEICTSFSSLVQSLLPKNILLRTTAGDWDCVAAVERLFQRIPF